MKKLFTVALAALAACSVSHDPASIDASISTAETYLSAGELADALRTADAVYQADSASLSATQLSRLAVAYMEIADRSDDPTKVWQAVKCYRRATSEQPDSAAAYFSSLPLERDHYYIVLSEIVRRIETPRDIPADEPIDDPADESVDTII